ncbi:MAG TPA: DUF2059 domain-containing protein [Chitinophagaceae bacterium]|jgi:hypothetical protein|nr:DUF2059 domain-containing protein [Chitinophagaceae bacterium]
MKLIILVQVILIPFLSFSQIDSAFILKLKALDTANILKADTVTVPNDALTRKIKQLLGEKNGLSVTAILKIKIMDEQQKDTVHSKEFYRKLMEDITTGKTSKLLENSLVNIYRRTFTENEVDELIKFFQTSAGKKMDKEFLFLLVQSVKDGEQLLKLAVKNLENDK